jgi:hypothetical protein
LRFGDDDETCGVRDRGTDTRGEPRGVSECRSPGFQIRSEDATCVDGAGGPDHEGHVLESSFRKGLHYEFKLIIWD